MLSKDEIQALGLGASEWDNPVEIPWRADETAYGKGSARTLLLNTVVSLGLFLGPENPSHLEQQGIVVSVLQDVLPGGPSKAEQATGPPVSEQMHVIKLSGGGQPIELRCLGDQDAVVADPKDANTYVVDLERARVVAAFTADGVTVYREGAHGLEVIVMKRLVSIPELAPINAPEWLHPGSAAAGWLRLALEQHLQQDDSWHNVVAAGLYARFAPYVGSGGEASVAAARNWQAPAVQTQLALPRNWFRRDLKPQEHETVDLLLMAEIDHLFFEIENLREEMACDHPDWQAGVLELCRARDNIEGVRILFNETTFGPRVTRALEPLDAEATTFLRSIPVKLRLTDERLRSVAEFDAEAWWVSIVDRG